MLLRGVALPIGLGVVWVLGIENLVSGMAESVLSALQPLRDVLPGVNAGSLVTAVMLRAPGVDHLPAWTRAWPRRGHWSPWRATSWSASLSHSGRPGAETSPERAGRGPGRARGATASRALLL